MLQFLQIVLNNTVWHLTYCHCKTDHLSPTGKFIMPGVAMNGEGCFCGIGHIKPYTLERYCRSVRLKIGELLLFYLADEAALQR